MRYQRTPTDRCAKCRKQFNSGDRVTPVYIVEKAGKVNPKNLAEGGAILSGEFEMGHISCIDPQLIKDMLFLE